MPQITALVHTHNDGLRLGRCLETVYPCDEIVVVDHGSNDDTLLVAREYGARIFGVKVGTPVHSSREPGMEGWILCLDPRESLTEALSASLYEWKTEALPGNVSSFSVMLREETGEGWIEHPLPQTRLILATWHRWDVRLPENDPAAVVLQGEILRFALP